MGKAVQTDSRRSRRGGKLRLKEWDYRCADSLRQEAHQALKDEFSAAQDRSRSEKLSLERGIYQGETADYHCYRFEVPPITAKSIDADRPHAVEVHGNQVDGSIISVSERSIDIALSEYHGRVVPMLDVVFDLSLLIDLVDRRICDIDKDASKYNVGIPDKLFGSLDWPGTAERDCQLDHINRGDGIRLTQDQLGAIRKAISDPLCLIWGPPGTGKTITLVGVIAELLSAGERVLFTSNTNSAIDNVLEKILPQSQCPYETLGRLRDEHSIVRIGAQADEKVRNQFSPRAIAEDLSAEIRAELEPLHSRLSELRGRETEIKAVLASVRRARKTCSEWDALQSEYQAVEQEGGTAALEEAFLKAQSKYQEYEAAVSEILPSLKAMIESSTATYEAIRSLRETVHSAGLLQGSQTSRLSGVRQQIAATDSEMSQLQFGWLKQKMNRTRLSQLQAAAENLQQEEASLAGQLQASEARLSSLVEKEARLMGQLHRALSPLDEITDGTSAVIRFVVETSIQNRILSHKLASDPLFADDRELLGTFLENDVIEYLQILFSIASLRASGNRDPLQEHLASLCTNADSRLVSARNLEARLESKSEDHAKASALLAEHGENDQPLIDESARLGADMDELRTKIAELEARLEKLEEQIIAEAQLLCTTMIKASYDVRFIAKEFDVLVVDEFSMVSLPQLYCVSALVKEHVILCGDHLQLPPISQSTSVPGKKWMAASFYDWHEGSWDERKATAAKGAQRLKPFMAKLETQRRMPEPISALVRPWYEDEGNSLADDWRTAAWERLHPNSHSLLADHITILDTTETNAYSSRSSSGSHYNLIHAGITGEVYRELIQEHAVPPGDILLVAPYRDQAALSRAVVSQLCDANTASLLEAGMLTIHKSQGKGSPIVIYDLTDGAQQGLTGFHKQEQPNLVNVALTRSEAHLILLCSYAKMRRALDEQIGSALSDVFQRLIRANTRIINAKPYADRVFRQVDISDLLVASSTSLTEEQKNSILVLNSATYYQALKDDFRSAEESILIVSPFVTRNRMDRLMPMIEELRATRGDGIHIELITRPPDKMFDRSGDAAWSGAAVKQILDRLIGLDVVVTLSPDTHGKLVVFDNRVNYWGSLNPLSFRDTDEINTRLDAEGLSKKLIQLARSGRSWPYQSSGSDYPEQEVASDYRTMAKRDLRNLAWSLAGLYKRPRLQLMWAKTIDALVSDPPASWDEYRQLPELKRRGCVLCNHLEQIEDIIYPIRGERLLPEVTGQDGGQLSLFEDETPRPKTVVTNERFAGDRLGAALSWAKSKGNTAESATTQDLRAAILAVLRRRPNNSCALHSLTKEVCSHLGIRTHGEPRKNLEKRLLRAVNTLAQQKKVKKYKTQKNERVRLLMK